MINNKNIFTFFSPVSSTLGRKPFGLSQNICDESKFRKDLQQTKNEHRTSSPTDFKSFIQSSMHTDASDFQSSQAHAPLEGKGKWHLTHRHFRAVKKKQIYWFIWIILLQVQRGSWERLLTNWIGGFCPMSSRAIEGFMVSQWSIFQTRSLRLERNNLNFAVHG